MRYVLITDPIALNAGIANWTADGSKHRMKGHELLVSCLVHVAIHGNVKPLNNMFTNAATNERTMIRNYVRRFQTEMELVDSKFQPKRDEDGNEVQTDVSFLDFAKQEFHVRGGHMKNRERFVPFAEKNLLQPSARWPSFTDINIRAESTRFDTMSLAKRMKTLLASARKGAANIAPKALKRLEEAAEYVASVADDFAEGAAEAAQDDKAMAEGRKAYAADFDRRFEEADDTATTAQPAVPAVTPAATKPKAPKPAAQSGNA